MRLVNIIVLLLATIATAINTGDSRLDFNELTRELSYKLEEIEFIDKETITNPDSEKCPPCFNCNLPNFNCAQFSTCNPFTGRCECKNGFGGDDCSIPLCGGLSDGVNRPKRPNNSTCDCSDGWSGINCNMCERDDVCNSFVPVGLKGTCYKSGIIVNNFNQMCDVTNEKILKILNGKIPQVTFSCNATSKACDFQFWIDQIESFYCDLSTCDFQYDLNANTTHYKCEEAECSCLSGRMLCGENGSIDISDFLTHEIKGPADFTCDLESQNCKFSEPSMNGLISSVFGDPQINLFCESSECVHKSEIPGFEIPGKKKFTLIDFTKLSSVFFGCVVVVILLFQKVKSSPLFLSSIALPLDDDNSNNDDGEMTNANLLLENYKQATLSFDNINYAISEKPILNSSYGQVRPGECMAIMGSSGAGKSTLLDILACKSKGGIISGDIYVNGKKLESSHEYKIFKNSIGFVNQDDIMIPTLTVYETVLNSALLRLPNSMPFKIKQAKVLQLLSELKIYHIKDMLIGSDFERGISGGEKRRVAIACELVTSPSILFLDEPTSGLDGYNAFNVVECLVRLAKVYNRTIIFTIHQPRSNIVSLFDKLLLLSNGDLIYSGEMGDCAKYFSSIGFTCPVGYNIADYLIDITNEKIETIIDEALSEEREESHTHDSDPTTETSEISEWQHYASHRDELAKTLNLNKKIIIRNDQNLAQFFKDSYVAISMKTLINEQINNSNLMFFDSESSNSKASWFYQLIVLSSRTFKNSYRNPKLLLGHYLLSLIMGLFCSYLYYDVENNISGFQNRLGLFFFLLTLFGFSSLTSLDSFSKERAVFVRERSNNYYHPLSYYCSKLICDVLPLRLLPPIILLAIIYPLVGLNMTGYKFWISIAILVLFNLVASLEILVIGISIKDSGSAIIVSVLIMLFSLLFSGLFINKETIPYGLEWIEKISVFHYAYESLAVNEVNGLVLKEKKFGLNIEVPGAVILSTFGFDVTAINWDIGFLGILFGICVILGGTILSMYVYEVR